VVPLVVVVLDAARRRHVGLNREGRVLDRLGDDRTVVGDAGLVGVAGCGGA
jgi:hypothetical protein